MPFICQWVKALYVVPQPMKISRLSFCMIRIKPTCATSAYHLEIYEAVNLLPSGSSFVSVNSAFLSAHILVFVLISCFCFCYRNPISLLALNMYYGMTKSNKDNSRNLCNSKLKKVIQTPCRLVQVGHHLRPIM